MVRRSRWISGARLVATAAACAASAPSIPYRPRTISAVCFTTVSIATSHLCDGCFKAAFSAIQWMVFDCSRSCHSTATTTGRTRSIRRPIVPNAINRWTSWHCACFCFCHTALTRCTILSTFGVILDLFRPVASPASHSAIGPITPLSELAIDFARSKTWLHPTSLYHGCVACTSATIHRLHE